MTESKLAIQFLRWTALSSLALLAVTWRLWTPQSLFPQIPFFSWLCQAPHWIDWLCVSALSVALLCLTISTTLRLRSKTLRRRPKSETFLLIMVIGALATLIGLDQHRLQPWAYELGIVAVVWTGFQSDAKRLTWMRWILVSIYCYSALGKFDFEFLHTVGQQMLGALLRILGSDTMQLTESVRVAIAATFPLYELLIGIGLAFPRTRRLAGVAALLLHGGLIVILGPAGLNHRTGVLVWNIQVAVQTYWLFIAKREATTAGETLPTTIPSDTVMAKDGLRHRLCVAVLSLVIILPATERFELWDHWPSWALYAPHSSRVKVDLMPQAIAKLPPQLRGLIEPRGGENKPSNFEWVALPIDAWSLESLDSPIYPQARFQLGVAEALAGAIDAEYGIRATTLGVASRFSGERYETVLLGRREIKSAGNFWLNTHCRPHFSGNSGEQSPVQ